MKYLINILHALLLKRNKMDNKPSKKNGNIFIPTKLFMKFINENEDRLFSRPHYVYVIKEENKKIYSFLELSQLTLMNN